MHQHVVQYSILPCRLDKSHDDCACQQVERLEPLTQLEDLWLNNNNIATLDGLENALKAQRESLTTIYLEGNAAGKQPGYKATMLALLPKLEQLDSNVLS